MQNKSVKGKKEIKEKIRAVVVRFGFVIKGITYNDKQVSKF